ncbi:MAG: strawberry notch family protein [Acidobacteria bacterium]|nr:strawberry notch family protein [Acidobacteriota bacterium]
MHDFVAHLKEKLRGGVSFNNPRLTEAANKFFGGQRGAGRYTPRDAYDALEAAANQLLLEERAAELMRSPVSDALDELRRFAGRLPTQSDRTYEQVEFQQFSSPPPLAYVASRMLGAQPGEVIIEPSAGTASLAIWPRAIGAHVICNEIAPRRRALLEMLGFETHAVDGELLDDLLPAEIQPAGFLMNPPFSATNGRVARHDPIYGAKHVETSLRRMEKGGRLVAITSAAMAMGASRFAEWWRRVARAYNIRASVTIGGGEFAKSGTSVDAQLIVIDKDGPTPGIDWKEQLENIECDRFDSLEEAWEKLKGLTVRTPREEAAEEETPVQVFVPYHTARLTGGQPHPAVIVESASMASVPPPIITYRPMLPPRVVEDGALSIIQMERVIYAGQRHEQRLPDGARGGFFVGDGTGVGKGRTLAAIIADNWNRGRNRAIWFSVNNDLMDATKRDLNDIGVGHIPLARINDYSANGEITLQQGVIFSSYSSLISQSKDGKRRIDQIQRWLGREGVIIFDEAHKAKNALASGFGQPTQTGQAVIDLQSSEKNPDYRVVYSSATGATDVRNMVYMMRLGLWGPGTSFPSGFNQFLNEIEAGGVGAMEMVSRDMKALGMYLSGSISFGVCPHSGKAVEYREVIHYLTPEQHEMYNRAAAAWQHVLKNIDEAIQVTGGSARARSLAVNKFWGDHQRFFRQIICAFKAPTVIAETEKALAEGKSVVISLVGTGEARTQDQIGRALASGATLEDLDFTPREVIAQMIERGFPTTVYQDKTDPITGKKSSSVVTDKKGAPVQSREALRMKQELLDGLSALHLPENPLDQIVNYFGEGCVAELTGRTRRLIRDPKTGKVTYKKRAPEGVAMDRANVHEMRQFQSGKKRVAIISDAASMGISLHASNREANKQRRVHITLELGWSADKQMQVFGRTHRSDQAVPPEYALASISLRGEKRFCSTIARRLASLGALTKGDRGAADSGDLAKYNFETPEGRAALSLMFRAIMRGDEVQGLDDPRQTLRDMGLLTKDANWNENVRREDETNVPRFLNRVLALDVDRQNAIFNYFASLFDHIVSTAKANGTFDEGVTDVRAIAIRFARPPRIVATDEITAAETKHYVLEVDQATPTLRFEEADRERRDKAGAFLRHLKKEYIILALPSRFHTDVDTGATYRTFAIKRPEGSRWEYLTEAELARKFRPIEPEQAREWWDNRCAELPAIETSEMHVIGGAILPLWQRLKTSESSGLHIVRVTTEDGRRIVGAQIPQERVGPVLRSLGISRNLKSPKEIFEAVWRNNDEVELATGLRIIRTSVHKEMRIELCELKYFHYATLRDMNLIEEYVQYRTRFFIPTEEEAGVAALAKVLKAYPQSKSAEEVEEEEVAAFEDAPVEIEVAPINLATWLIPPPEVRREPTSDIPVESPAPSPTLAENAPPEYAMGVPRTAAQSVLFER